MDLLLSYAVMAWCVAFVLSLERFRPAVRGQRGEWASNAVAYVALSLCQTGAATLWATTETRLVNGLGGGVFDLTRLPWWLGGAVYFVAMDLGEYLFHRAQHAVPWLWAMHSLHHSDRGLNATSSMRHFWLEPAIKTVTIWLAVALALKVTPAMLHLYAVITLANLLTHANLRIGFGPLSWLWNSPQYHRMHHATDPRYHNANFACLLPVFDVLTGSYRRPAREEFPATGLEEAVTHPLQTLVWPIRGLFRFRRRAIQSQPIG